MTDQRVGSLSGSYVQTTSWRRGTGSPVSSRDFLARQGFYLHLHRDGRFGAVTGAFGHLRNLVNDLETAYRLAENGVLAVKKRRTADRLHDVKLRAARLLFGVLAVAEAGAGQRRRGSCFRPLLISAGTV